MLTTKFSFEQLAARGGSRKYPVTIDGRPDGSLEYFWIDDARIWAVIRTDDDGDQIGDADDAANRRTLPGALERMATTSLADLAESY